MTGPKRFLIRLRWERGAYTSTVMPQPEAEARAAELAAEIVACGDGTGFVEFTGYDGRTVRVRGREVVGIECVPHREDAERAGPSFAAALSGEAVTSAVLRDGTEFLRRVAGAHR